MDYTSLLETLLTGLSNAGTKIAAYVPKLLTAAIVLVVGWVTARLVKAVVVSLLKGLDNLWRKYIIKKEIPEVHHRYSPTKVIGEISFWLIILFFSSMSADIMGLTVFVSWISQVVSFFPLLIAGGVIIAAGIILSSLVRNLVTSAASSAGVAQSELIGRILQGTILVTSIVIGVDQIGIDITFLSIIAAIILSTTLGAVALAFGFGARNHVANIIAGHNVRRRYRTGDSVRVREVEGKIVKLESTEVVIDTGDGLISVPASVFDKELAILIERED